MNSPVLANELTVFERQLRRLSQLMAEDCDLTRRNLAEVAVEMLAITPGVTVQPHAKFYLIGVLEAVIGKAADLADEADELVPEPEETIQ